MNTTKLIFKKIWGKNFLSIGAVPVELDYRSGINAVIAKPNNGTTNGQGKSTLFDLLIYILFGVSMRKANKMEMVNEINEGECEGKLWISANGINYRIERGINPDYFNLINEDDEAAGKQIEKKAAKKITQSDLEKILGISFVSFINAITLNINYSKPFFKLTAAEKRQILDDILNLNVYGRMFEKVKKDFNEFKYDKRNIENSLNSAQEVYTSKKRAYEQQDQEKKNFEIEKQNKIIALETSLSVNRKKLEEFKSKIPEKDYKEIRTQILEKKQEIQDKVSTAKAKLESIKSDIIRCQKDIDNIKRNPICPLCKTPTDISQHSQLHIKEQQTLIDSYNADNTKYTDFIEKCKPVLESLNEKYKKVDDTINKVESLKIIINRLEVLITSEEEKLEALQKSQYSAKNVFSEEEIQADEQKIEKIKENLKSIEKKMKYLDYSKQVLGDEGIKKYIFRTVLPLLNKKCNEYLVLFNAKYSAIIDSDLNEVFKVRNKKRKYVNFSAGEQKRIDLAIMFALLDVAKAQYSISTNLLILDEIIDSSLCSTGINQLMNFLKTEYKKQNPDTCVYVISHKSEIAEHHFNRIITVKKENEFTKIDSIREINQVIQL